MNENAEKSNFSAVAVTAAVENVSFEGGDAVLHGGGGEGNGGNASVDGGDAVLNGGNGGDDFVDDGGDVEMSERGRGNRVSSGRVKEPWSREEDLVLMELINKFGARNWSMIAQGIPGRSGKSCRLRWCNQLDPLLKRKPFTGKTVALCAIDTLYAVVLPLLFDFFFFLFYAFYGALFVSKVSFLMLILDFAYFYAFCY